MSGADRLTDSRKLEQRLAGLELLHLLNQRGKVAAACRASATRYQDTRGELSEAEKVLVESITGREEEHLTLDDALGLMNPAGRTRTTPPVKRKVQPTSKAAISSLLSLDALIQREQSQPIHIKTWQGENQELLLANVGWQFPQTDARSPIEEDVTRLPLHEVWEQ